jgi:hypothetical protein
VIDSPQWWLTPLLILVAGIGLAWLIDLNAGHARDDGALAAFLLLLAIVGAVGVLLGRFL